MGYEDVLRHPHARPPRKDKRERRRLAQRRYRQRADHGCTIVQVEINAQIVEMLIASRWLTEGDCGDRGKIGAAVGAMITEAAKR